MLDQIIISVKASCVPSERISLGSLWRFSSLLSRIILLTMSNLFLSVVVFAVDMVVDNSDKTKAPEIKSGDDVPKINIVNPENGISHNRFERYNVDEKGAVINNSSRGSVTVAGVGVVGANPKLTEPAKTILFEVTGANRSELLGTTTIAGDQAKFILANPNGITCDGCGFINTDGVELKTDRIRSIANGVVDWAEDSNADIHIAKGGVTVAEKSLMLNSEKIRIEGKVSIKGLLLAEAHRAKHAAVGTDMGGGEKYAIDINTVSPITAGKIYLIATDLGVGVRVAAPKNESGENSGSQATLSTRKGGIYIQANGPVNIDGNLRSAEKVKVLGRDLTIAGISTDSKGDVELRGRKVDVTNVVGAQNLVIQAQEVGENFKLNNVENVEIVGEITEPGAGCTVDFKVVNPLEIGGSFNFVGRGFKNQNIFTAREVKLGLTGDFINDINGNITVKDGWISTSNNFINYQKMDIGKSFLVKTGSFINDKSANISADSISIYSTGKMEDGNGLYQGSDSILESRSGGMKLVSLQGGMYFGYKKELTGAGDNGDGFTMVGSRLVSRGKPIHIQSEGDVVLDGVQVSGDIRVETKGVVEERIPTDSYKNDMQDIGENIAVENGGARKEVKKRDVYGEVTKTRTVTKTEQRTRNVEEDVVKSRTVYKPETRSREVFDHTETWCPSGISIFGGCIGGLKHRDHYRTEYYTEQVPVQEFYTERVTRQVTEEVQVPVEEAYVVREVIGQEAYVDVSLKGSFAGDKQFFANQAGLMFKTEHDDDVFKFSPKVFGGYYVELPFAELGLAEKKVSAYEEFREFDGQRVEL